MRKKKKHKWQAFLSLIIYFRLGHKWDGIIFSLSLSLSLSLSRFQLSLILFSLRPCVCVCLTISYFLYLSIFFLHSFLRYIYFCPTFMPHSSRRFNNRSIDTVLLLMLEVEVVVEVVAVTVNWSDRSERDEFFIFFKTYFQCNSFVFIFLFFYLYIYFF